MTDLDFDELDRAVSSLLNRDEASSPAPKAVESSAQDQTPPPAPVAAPPTHEHPTPNVVIPKRAAPLGAKRPLAPAAARGNRGGIIDIVAPKPASLPPARVASQLTPISDEALLRASTAPMPPALEKQPEASIDIAPSQPSTQTPPLQQPPQSEPPMPDSFAFKEAEQTAEEPVIEHESTPPPLKAGQGDEAPITPQESIAEEKTIPFVDAPKVEKRPLGAYSDYTPPEAKPEPTAESTTTPTPSEEMIPPELSPEVLAAESHEEAGKKKPAAGTKKVPEARQPNDDLHQTAMLSIPKQYQTATKPLDTTAHPIYDSKEYHPPLIEPQAAKKKSKRGLKVLIIVLIIVILAAIGFVAYQFFAKTQPPVS